MTTAIDQRWDLDVFFPGGSESTAFREELAALETGLPALATSVSRLELSTVTGDPSTLTQVVGQVQQLSDRLTSAWGFAYCLTKQDRSDRAARLLLTRMDELWAGFEAILPGLDHQLAQIPDSAWRGLLQGASLKDVAFGLDERRRRVAEALSAGEESLAAELSPDGMTAWAEVREAVSELVQTGCVLPDGNTATIGGGQLGKWLTNPDRETRADAFACWESAWEEYRELAALALNHFAGYRLTLAKRRGWETPLQGPLGQNRLSPGALDAMWAAIAAGQEHCHQFLRRKAELLGVPALGWSDLRGSLPGEVREIPYQEGADFIIEQFGRTSAGMGVFARRAFAERWVDAEDRPGKSGGFSTSFPAHRQSRLSATWTGRPAAMITLAHELGHAYLGATLADLPMLARQIPPTLEETAATLAELAVTDAAVQGWPDERERLLWLDFKLNRLTLYLFTMRVRYLFETRFYDARRRGPLAADELNELALGAEREVFGASLGTLHPLLWIENEDFYSADPPFYHFPYTAAYLFGIGLRARLGDGPGFSARYEALLRDTGRMTVDDLALKHLGVDLASTDFWSAAVDLATADVDHYLELSEGMLDGQRG